MLHYAAYCCVSEIPVAAERTPIPFPVIPPKAWVTKARQITFALRASELSPIWTLTNSESGSLANSLHFSGLPTNLHESTHGNKLPLRLQLHTAIRKRSLVRSPIPAAHGLTAGKCMSQNVRVQFRMRQASMWNEALCQAVKEPGDGKALTPQALQTERQ